jgi:hypothetical protein
MIKWVFYVVLLLSVSACSNMPDYAGDSSRDYPREVRSVYLSGTVVIHGMWLCVLDEGKEEITGSTTDDFFWRMYSSVVRTLVPEHGASYSVIGPVDFNSVDYQSLKDCTCSATNIIANIDATNTMPSGTVIAAKPVLDDTANLSF